MAKTANPDAEIDHCQPHNLVEASRRLRSGRAKMAFPAIVGAIIAGIGVWYYRLRVLRDIGGDLADLAGRARGAYRRRRFRQQADEAALGTIDDPALAAAVFLYALANEDKSSLHKAGPVIQAQLAPLIAPERLAELLSHAQWAARDIVDPGDVVRRFKPLWREVLTVTERRQLVAMAEAVAAQSNESPPGMTLSIEALRTAFRQ
jgi:hypothetical protein